jgi:hypothetical protein
MTTPCACALMAVGLGRRMGAGWSNLIWCTRIHTHAPTRLFLVRADDGDPTGDGAILVRTSSSSVKEHKVTKVRHGLYAIDGISIPTMCEDVAHVVQFLTAGAEAIEALWASKKPENGLISWQVSGADGERPLSVLCSFFLILLHATAGRY